MGRLEAALALLGEDNSNVEPLKVALTQGRMHARTRPVGERLDLCSSACYPREGTSGREQRRKCEKPGKPGAEGGEVGPWIARFGGFRASTNLSSAEHPTSRRGGGVELTSLRAQVAESQSERHAIQEAESSR